MGTEQDQVGAHHPTQTLRVHPARLGQQGDRLGGVAELGDQDEAAGERPALQQAVRLHDLG
jgi:hypothetical protein